MKNRKEKSSFKVRGTAGGGMKAKEVRGGRNEREEGRDKDAGAGEEEIKGGGQREAQSGGGDREIREMEGR